MHHLAGHIAADTLEHGPPPDACMVLIASDGHTSPLLVRDLAGVLIVCLGDTIGDAATVRTVGIAPRLLLLRAEDLRRPVRRAAPAAERGAAARGWGPSSLREAVADALTRMAVAACRERGVRTLVPVCGVAADSCVYGAPRRDLPGRRSRAAGPAAGRSAARPCGGRGAAR
ncbi:hypothetical protein [Streptomyces sp. TE33382]